nr:MAG TPA: hypothetical protein [Caudoviricetes sp.]
MTSYITASNITPNEAKHRLPPPSRSSSQAGGKLGQKTDRPGSRRPYQR